MKEISVVIPAYNEGQHIGFCLHETALALQGLDYEIIAVDDGSTDNTYQEMLTAAAENDSIRILHLPDNRGKGGAILYGCQHAKGDIIAFLDADLELHPKQLLLFIKAMEEAQADIVIGSKTHPESRVSYPTLRRIISRGYAFWVQFLFGLELRDTQTGIKIFRAYALKRIIPRLHVQQFAFDVEMLVAASRFGYRIIEIPVEVVYQRGNGGRIRMPQIWGMFVDTMRIYYQASFWKWLEPSFRVKFWMIVFVTSLVFASFGAAHWLTLHISIPPSVSGVFRIITLRFLNTEVRDWIMIVVGLFFGAWALVVLNRSLLSAFARADQGNIAGIVRVSQRLNDLEEVNDKEG